ncbi:MAG: alpha/beta hydrolase-fold protein [Pseudomonadota bacterium]
MSDASKQSSEMAVNAERVDIRSSFNGKDYRLFVSVPSGPVPDGGYPVVYLIDGNLHFGATTDTARLQGRWVDTCDPLVVGIGYPTDSVNAALNVRNMDLTMPVRPGWIENTPWMKKMAGADAGIKHGKVDDYLRTVLGDIRPRIEADYGGNPNDATLMGHSLGGLTTAYALSTPEFRKFDQYVAISPSLWWNDFTLIDEIGTLRKDIEAGRVKARVLMTAGEHEAPGEMFPHYSEKLAAMGVEKKDMVEMTAYCDLVDATQRFVDALRPAQSETFQIEYFTHPREDHRTAAGAGVVRGITFAMYRP